jgi:CDP-diacylglycerol--glycerol-3-phosphate 3-phosphatidyltransferase/cardiolipin synthase
VPVSTVAKWKTAAQLVALGFLIAGPAGAALMPASVQIGTVLLWVAAILTLYTGWDYMKASYDHVADE